MEAKGDKKSRDVAMDGIMRAAGPYYRNNNRYLDTWWEWVSGSTPFFWNWIKEYQKEVRDGQPHSTQGTSAVSSVVKIHQGPWGMESWIERRLFRYDWKVTLKSDQLSALFITFTQRRAILVSVWCTMEQAVV